MRMVRKKPQKLNKKLRKKHQRRKAAWILFCLKMSSEKHGLYFLTSSVKSSRKERKRKRRHKMRKLLSLRKRATMQRKMRLSLKSRRRDHESTSCSFLLFSLDHKTAMGLRHLIRLEYIPHCGCHGHLDLVRRKVHQDKKCRRCSCWEQLAGPTASYSQVYRAHYLGAKGFIFDALNGSEQQNI